MRVGIATAEFGKLRHVWADAELPLDLKIRLFKVGIVSILAYGVESWNLTADVMRALRGWNSRCLHRLTGRSHREECVDPTFDLVGHLQQRRQKWIKCLLDSPEESLPRRVFLAEAEELLKAGERYPEGSLLAECPPHSSMEELLSVGDPNKKATRGL